MKALHLEIAELRNEKIEREVNEVISKAIAEGRLLPAQESWARALGGVNMQSLKDYVATSQPIAALNGTQTGGNPPEGETGVQLTDSQRAVCAATGVSLEDFIKTLQARQAQA